MAVVTQTVPELNGHTNGDVDMDNVAKDSALRFTSGLILPPPEIKCEHPLLKYICLQCYLLWTKHNPISQL